VTSTTLNPGQDKQSGFELSTSVLRDMSDIILKKLMSRSKNAQVTETRNTSTTTTTGKPPWQDNAEGKLLYCPAVRWQTVASTFLKMPQTVWLKLIFGGQFLCIITTNRFLFLTGSKAAGA